MVEFEKKRSVDGYYHTINVKNLTFRKHIHKSFEIVLVTDGELNVCVENRSFVLRAGQGIMIAPYKIHSFTTSRSNSVFSVIISPEHLEDFYDLIKNKEFLSPVFAFDISICERLKEELTNYFERKSILYSFCHQVSEKGLTNVCTLKNYSLLNEILLYIDDHYDKDISLKSMCRDLGYSYHYISGTFKSNFGESFPSYINQMKLRKAERLLKTTNSSITQIAYECGFNTVRNFNTAFKRTYGKSPDSYRKNIDIQQ